MGDSRKVYKSVKKILGIILNTDDVLEFMLEYNTLLFVLESKDCHYIKWVGLKEEGIHLEDGLEKRLYDKIVSVCIREIAGRAINLEKTLSQLVRISMYIKTAKNHPGSTFTVHRKSIVGPIETSDIGLSLDKLIDIVVNEKNSDLLLENIEYIN